MRINPFRNLSIRWKVALATSFYILLVLVGAIFYTAYSFEQKLLKEKNQNIIENIKNIIESYKDSFVLKNLEKIDEMTRKIDNLPSVFFVKVFDTGGRIIGDIDLSNLGKTEKDFLKKIPDKPYIKKDKNIISFYYPVKIDSDTIGYVITRHDLKTLKESIDREIFKILVQTFAIASMVIIASFLGVFLISGHMVKPLIDLKNKITEITGSYIDSSKLDVEPVPQNDKDCIKSLTSECWLTSEKGGEILLNIGDTALKECSSCEKFKQLSGDEIRQLNYSFYMMVASLKEYLRKLDEAHRERETLNCMATMGEMSAKIAHEIKNALYAIGNAANYLRQNIDNELVKEFSGIIKDEVNRLNKMTVSFLNFSKLIEPKFQKGDINEEIKNSVMLLKPDMDDEGIRLIIETDPDMPEFEFDKNLIKQMIFNLILNSIDALKDKKGDKFIRIKTEYIKLKDKDIARLIIEDNGEGIEPENKDKIFKPFFTTKQKGTGLGLPMVYKIVFSHNGAISMESEKGKGTAFIIDFRI
ncbi:ATP-binding protein [Persephonella sp. KM09-Lau-8]|uniref:ATP-binding protein n=1 Tax=Persephonella sp. KM09-Lau-8 TaxID=1158345 RepID=UPI000494DF3A|nr:ATP-binding protein [Persephonella sp. KM09-Lau-8]